MTKIRTSIRQYWSILEGQILRWSNKGGAMPSQKFAETWVQKFSRAVSEGVQDEALRLLAEAPEILWNNPVALRRWLNPLGRQKFFGLQLAVWARISRIEELSGIELDRAIRLIDSHQASSESVLLRLPGFDPIAILCAEALANDDVRGLRCSQINLQCARHFEDADHRAFEPLARIIASSLGASTIRKGLQQIDDGLSLRYVHALYVPFLRKQDYLGAQRIIGWLVQSENCPGSFLYRYIRLLILRNHITEAVDAFGSRQFVKIGLRKTGLLLKQSRRLRLLFLQVPQIIPSERLLQTWLTSAIWRMSKNDEVRVEAELNHRPVVELSRSFTAVLNEEPTSRFVTVHSLAVRRARKALSGEVAEAFKRAGKDSRVLSLISTPSAELEAKPKGELFTDFMRLQASGRLRPAFADPPKNVDAILSFAPVSKSLLTRHPELQAKPHIRLGRVGTSLAEARVLAYADLPAIDNLETDFAAARQAEDAGLHLGRRLNLMRGVADGTQKQLQREFISLVIEDRIYPGLKRQASVAQYLLQIEAKEVVVVATAAYMGRALEMVYALKGLGVTFTLAFDAGNVRDRSAALTLIQRGDTTLREAVLSTAIDELARLPPPDEKPGEVEPGGPLKAQPSLNSRPTVLIIASLSDPSYRVSTIALIRQLSKTATVIIFSPLAQGAEEVRVAVEGAEIYVGADNHVESLTRVRRELLGALAKEFNAKRKGFPVSLMGNLSRLGTAAAVGLAVDMDSLEQIVSLMDTRHPDLILTIPGRMTSARAATILAQHRKIPVLDAQAFFISRHPRYKASLANIYAGITEDQLDVYREKSPPEDQKIERIGSLMIGEQLARVRDLERGAARTVCGVPADRQMIVYGAQHGQGQEGEEVIRLLVRAANALPDSVLIVKVHPRTAGDAIEAIRRVVEVEATGDVRIQKDGDVYALMLAADLVVTQFSNVGLEAAMMNRPVLSINLTGQDYIVDLVRMGVAERGATPEEVIDKVERLLNDETTRAHLERSRNAYFARNPELADLSAATRVEALVWSALLEKNLKMNHLSPVKRTSIV